MHQTQQQPPAAGENRTYRGRVVFFNAAKGFGFIHRDDGPDVFVHFSEIAGDGYRQLAQDQEVEFEIGPGKKPGKLEAKNVRAL